MEIPSSSGLAKTMRVGLLPGEPAGMIVTRTAASVEFEATLEWPPGCKGDVSVLDLLPVPESGVVYGPLKEAAGDDRATVCGELSCFEEERMSGALDGVLRAVSSAAAVREAVLRTRVLRTGRVWCPASGAVGLLARHVWGSGFRVGFGASWGPPAPGADVMLGCRGAREELAAALGASRLDRAGAPG